MATLYRQALNKKTPVWAFLFGLSPCPYDFFMLKLKVRENMKTLISFLSVLLCVAPFGVANAVVSSTVGSNLTAYNGEAGAINNNRWNTLMNARTGGTTATADFGNCNAVVMRCAQPKCSNGGCTDLSVTSAIVSGCVQSNASCKQYGDDLVQYISAQLVAQSTAKVNAANAAAQTAAANAAAQQSAQQMAAMQQQMQQMQNEMAAQNAQTVAQLQSALEEQKQLTANAIAEAQSAQQVATVSQPVQQSNSVNGLTDAQVAAAQNGVSADVLAREQITGQIMSAIENAEVQLKTLKATMTDVFNYAGCDSRGNNCTGPKRVKMFKQKAEGFFDPYESVLDELYDALILAQSVGVDITDIYMMLNGSCNVWGQYLCGLGADSRQQLVCDDVTVTYDASGNATPTSGKNCHYVTTNALPTYTSVSCQNGRSVSSGGNVRGGHECVIGQVVPPEDDISCTLQKTIVDDGTDDSRVQRDWLWSETSDSGANIRVGCASSALESSTLFRNRKKKATIDIETLQKIIAQDAPAFSRSSKSGINKEQVKYCAVTEPMYANLQKLVTTKTLPTKDLCIDERKLNKNLENVLLINDESIIEMARASCNAITNAVFSEIAYRCFCEKDVVDGKTSEVCNAEKSQNAAREAEQKLCRSFGAEWNSSSRTCNCATTTYDEDKENCEYRFNGKTSRQAGEASLKTSADNTPIGSIKIGSVGSVSAVDLNKMLINTTQYKIQ